MCVFEFSSDYLFVNNSLVINDFFIRMRSTGKDLTPAKFFDFPIIKSFNLSVLVMLTTNNSASLFLLRLSPLHF
jgi:hypothetical protein